jgi:hypothetical protein
LAIGRRDDGLYKAGTKDRSKPSMAARGDGLYHGDQRSGCADKATVHTRVDFAEQHMLQVLRDSQQRISLKAVGCRAECATS